MTQYRITSASFLTPGESGDPDAVMDADDLAQLKQLAGVQEFGQTVAHNPLPIIPPKMIDDPMRVDPRGAARMSTNESPKAATPLREQKYNG